MLDFTGNFLGLDDVSIPKADNTSSWVTA